METLRRSVPIEIVLGDMELHVPIAASGVRAWSHATRSYPLRNRCRFTVVSRDRVRIHVEIEHKWRDYSDPMTWKTVLATSPGKVHQVAEVVRTGTDLRSIWWDEETRSAEFDARGNLVGVRDDGHLRRRPLSSISYFHGEADFDFYAPDLFTRDLRTLKVTLSRPDMTFTFLWRFIDDASRYSLDMATHGPVVASWQ